MSYDDEDNWYDKAFLEDDDDPTGVPFTTDHNFSSSRASIAPSNVFNQQSVPFRQDRTYTHSRVSSAPSNVFNSPGSYNAFGSYGQQPVDDGFNSTTPSTLDNTHVTPAVRAWLDQTRKEYNSANEINDRIFEAAIRQSRPAQTANRLAAAAGTELLDPLVGFRGTYNAMQASSISLESILGTENMYRGKGSLDEWGREQTGHRFTGKGNELRLIDASSGEVKLDKDQVRMAHEATRQVTDQVVGQSISPDGQNLVGTIHKNINTAIGKYVDKLMQSTQNDIAPEDAAIFEKTMKTMYNRMVSKVTDQLAGQDGFASSHVRGQAFNSAVDLNVHNEATAKEVLSRMPVGAQQAVDKVGFTAAYNSPTAQFFSGGSGEQGVTLGGWRRGGSSGGMNTGGGGRGGMGGLMHSAYIAKRMWSYTGEPVMAGAAEHVKSQGEYAALFRTVTGQDPITSDYGAQLRADEVSGAQNEAAFQNIGALGDAAWVANQGPNADANQRLIQGGKLAAGVGFMGTIAGGALTSLAAPGIAAAASAGVAVGGGTALLAGAGTVLSAAALPVAGALAAGFLGNEAYNLATGSDTGLGQKFMGGLYENAGQRGQIGALRAKGYMGLATSFNLEDLVKAYDVTDEETQAQMTPGMAAMYGQSQRQDDFSPYEKTIKDAATLTGGDKKASIAQARGLDVMFGGDSAKMLDAVGLLSSIDAPLQDSIAKTIGLAAQGGILPGDTKAMDNLIDQYAGTDDAGRSALTEEYGEYAAMGGMLGQYTGSARSGSSLAREEGLTAITAGTTQSYMAAATRYGSNMDDVVGYD